MATKKRKVDDECRIFNKEWGEKYFFVETNDQKPSCVICNGSVAVLKEYNIRRHYEAKHLSTHSEYSGKLRSEKFESMKRSLESLRNFFIKKFVENESIIRAFLEEVDSNFCDLPYYTEVRWLNCGKVLFRFYKLQREIDLFLTKKKRADPKLSDPPWLSKLSLLVDVTSHMDELNLKLQGKNNLVCDLYGIITAFRRKLSLFEAQLERENFFHFQYLDRIENEILLFENPSGDNLDNLPTELQLEFIDLQANTLLKEKHREGKLIEFYRCLPAHEFSKLKKFASGMASVFGTTYNMAISVSAVNIWNKSMSNKYVAMVIEITCWNVAIVMDLLDDVALVISEYKSGGFCQERP
eukprot:XP_014779098.1 PREDICTED: general transcription factor II-I repeat domain-containing protein 2-like [Octopus bimaculoides]